MSNGQVEHTDASVPGRMPTGRRIVSYFEPATERVLRRFDKHLDEIASHGFDTIVLCLSEADLDPRPLVVRAEMTRHARERGFAVLLDPWAVGGVFGGEAGSPFRDAGGTPCLREPAFRALMDRWLDAATELGPDGLFWDEPNLRRCGDCEGREVEFIAELAGAARRAGLRNSACFTSRERNLAALEELAATGLVDDVATDPYYAAPPVPGGDDAPPLYVGRYARAVQAISERHGVRCHIWVQGFGLPAGAAWVVEMAARAARDAGVTDLAFWGFRACASVPAIRPPDWRRVWVQVGVTFRAA